MPVIWFTSLAVVRNLSVLLKVPYALPILYFVPNPGANNVPSGTSTIVAYAVVIPAELNCCNILPLVNFTP